MDSKFGDQKNRAAGEAVIYDLAFDHHSQRFAVGSADNRITIYEIDKRKHKQVAEIKVGARVGMWVVV